MNVGDVFRIQTARLKNKKDSQQVKEQPRLDTSL